MVHSRRPKAPRGPYGPLLLRSPSDSALYATAHRLRHVPWASRRAALTAPVHTAHDAMRSSAELISSRFRSSAGCDVAVPTATNTADAALSSAAHVDLASAPLSVVFCDSAGVRSRPRADRTLPMTARAHFRV